MPWAPVCWSGVAYWSKSVAWTAWEATSVLVFQSYSSDEVPPGKRIRPVPAALSRPGTAASVRSASYTEPFRPIAVAGTVAPALRASTLTVADAVADAVADGEAAALPGAPHACVPGA